MKQELQQIIFDECIKHPGDDTVKFVYQTIVFGERYKAKKRFWGGYEWVLVETDEKEKVDRNKINHDLDSLPDGISFSVEKTQYEGYQSQTFGNYSDRILGKAIDGLRRPTWYGDTLLVVHKEVYYIIVNGAYVNSRLNIIGDKRVVILESQFDAVTLQEARSFNLKVLKEHADILEPLYKNGLEKYGQLDHDGFTDYDHGYSLRAVGMKPLTEQYQRLGLMMALADYGQKNLLEDEIYVIESSSGIGEKTVSCRRQKKSNGHIMKLKDW